MGEFVNATWLKIAGWVSAVAITAINVLLLVLVATGT